MEETMKFDTFLFVISQIMISFPILTNRVGSEF